ncbi:MAG: tandem-95 repeat protein, partial [Paenibacillus sp.]|nr:tandem-95 repeat protein [Paenibacillus sp.]
MTINEKIGSWIKHMNKKLYIYLFLTMMLGILLLGSKNADAAISSTVVSDQFEQDSGLWDYLGSAHRSTTGVAELTPPSQSKAGVMWFKNPLLPPYDVSFQMRMSNHSALYGPVIPADGIVFMFNKNKSTSPPSASQMGFEAGNGYGIEFDTYYNNDPGQSWDIVGGNHISLFKNNSNSGLSTDLLEQVLSPTNMTNQNWHDVRIQVRNDSVSVYMDNTLYIQKTLTLDPAYSYIGFSASTGHYYSRQQIDNVLITPIKEQPQVQAYAHSVSSQAVTRTYIEGETIPIDVFFPNAVQINSALPPTLMMNTGYEALYTAGSGTNTLHFDYIVRAADRVDLLNYSSTGALSDANITIVLPDTNSADSLASNSPLSLDGRLRLGLNFNNSTSDSTAIHSPIVYGTAHFIPGPTREAIQFEGIPHSYPGRLHIPSIEGSLDLDQELTVTFNAKLNTQLGSNGNGSTVPGGNLVVFAKETDHYGIVLFKPGNFSRTFQLKVTGAGGGTYTLPVNESIHLADWHHYSVIVSATQVSFYIDGILQTNGSIPLTSPLALSAANGYALSLARFANGWYPTNISMDNFRWYNTALTAIDIKQIYESQFQITNVSTAGVTGKHYRVGDVVSIRISFSGNVSVEGTQSPVLHLNNGGIAYYNASASTENVLAFDYTISSQDANSALLNYESPFALELNGSAIYTGIGGAPEPGTAFLANIMLPPLSSVSSLANQQLVVDTNAPAVDFTISKASLGQAALSISASDVLSASSDMIGRIWNGLTWTEWSSYSSLANAIITLPSRPEVTITVEIKDAAGNVGAATHTIHAPFITSGSSLKLSEATPLVIPSVMGNSSSYTEDSTIALWVYPESNAVYTIMKQDNNPSNGGIGRWFTLQPHAIGSSNELEVHYSYWASNQLLSSSNQLVSSNLIPIEQWTHLAFVKRNGVLELYINGQLDPSSAVAEPGWSEFTYYSNNAIAFGGSSTGSIGGAIEIPIGGTIGMLNSDLGGGSPPVLRVDQIQFLNTAVTFDEAFVKNELSTELDDSYPYFSNLTAYYPLNEGIGSIASDVINSNNGTVDPNQTQFVWEPDTIVGNVQHVEQATTIYGQLIAEDFEGDALEYTLIEQPSVGVFTFSNTGTFSYTPDMNTIGEVTFRYKVNDGYFDSPVLTKRITVTPTQLNPSIDSVSLYANHGGSNPTQAPVTVTVQSSNTTELRWLPGTNSLEHFEQSGNLVVGSSFEVSDFGTYTLLAKNSKTAIVYSFDVFSGNAELSSLAVEGFELEFDPEVSKYDITVPFAASSIELTYAVAAGSNATVQVTNDNPGHLDMGLNEIILIVTAQNGTTHSYTLNVNRIADPVISEMTFDPALPYAIDGNVTVSFTATGDELTAYKWLKGARTAADFAEDGETINGQTFVVHENGSYSLYVANRAGGYVIETFVVNQLDEEVPVITLTGPQPMWVAIGQPFVEPGYSATDNDSTDLAVVASGDINTSVAGEYTRSYTATDRSGNSSTVTRTVVVINNPIIATPVLSPTLSYSTKENVHVTASVTGDNITAFKWMKGSKSVVDFTLDGNLITGSTFTVTENSVYTLFAINTAGGYDLQQFVVDQIDRTAPLLALSATSPNSIYTKVGTPYQLPIFTLS